MLLCWTGDVVSKMEVGQGEKALVQLLVLFLWCCFKCWNPRKLVMHVQDPAETFDTLLRATKCVNLPNTCTKYFPRLKALNLRDVKKSTFSDLVSVQQCPENWKCFVNCTRLCHRAT